MKKYWKERLITHCIVGDTGGVSSFPSGCSIVKTAQTTANAHAYTQIITKNRTAVKPLAKYPPHKLFTASPPTSMSPETSIPLFGSLRPFTSPPSTSGTKIATQV